MAAVLLAVLASKRRPGLDAQGGLLVAPAAALRRGYKQVGVYHLRVTSEDLFSCPTLLGPTLLSPCYSGSSTRTSHQGRLPRLKGSL